MRVSIELNGEADYFSFTYLICTRVRLLLLLRLRIPILSSSSSYSRVFCSRFAHHVSIKPQTAASIALQPVMTRRARDNCFRRLEDRVYLIVVYFYLPTIERSRAQIMPVAITIRAIYTLHYQCVFSEVVTVAHGNSKQNTETKIDVIIFIIRWDLRAIAFGSVVVKGCQRLSPGILLPPRG